MSGDILKDLKLIADDVFPKTCSCCGKTYHNFDEYVKETVEPPRSGSGLMEGVGEDDDVVVEMYRNCTCGSTLMDFFSNRRDCSERGQKRREKFNRIVDQLVQKGIEAGTARNELLKLIRTGRSEYLEQKGIVLNR